MTEFFLKMHHQGQMHQKQVPSQGAREFGGEQVKNAEYVITFLLYWRI